MKKGYVVSQVHNYEGERLLSFHLTISGAWRAARRESAKLYRGGTIVGPGGDVKTMPRSSLTTLWLECGLSLFESTSFIAIDEIEIND